ncbi:hypothetical protein ACUOA8_62725, partial [Escherichia sp. SS-MK2]
TIDLPLDVLLGKTPKMTRDVQTLKAKGDALAREGITIADAVKRVLHLPGSFCPPDTQRGAAFAEYSLPV